MLKLLITSLCLLSTTSCQKVHDEIHPEVCEAVDEHFVKMLPSSFPPLSFDEAQTEWGREYRIALAFAEQLDLYRAVTTFKRAEILMPTNDLSRKRELQYYTLLCYYLGGRYGDAIDLFNASELRFVAPTFSTYHDLLVILYESYLKTKEEERALQYYKLLKQHFPKTADKLYLSTAMRDGNLTKMNQWIEKQKHAIPEEELIASTDTIYARSETTGPTWQEETADVRYMIDRYTTQKKSPAKAQALSLIPGAGYLYVGQKQSALTSFLLNGLFIGATTAFFSKGYYAAGLITASFEMGWYFGGMYGAGQAAKLYNERLYERAAFDTMRRDGLFPIFTLQKGF